MQALWEGLHLAYLGRLLLIILLSFTNPASAGSNFLALRGNILFTLCKSENLNDISSCDGYILGVLDSIYSGHLGNYFDLCFPPGINVTQMRLLIIKYMEQNPENINLTAEGFVAKAMQKSFECKKAE